MAFQTNHTNKLNTSAGFESLRGLLSSLMIVKLIHALSHRSIRSHRETSDSSTYVLLILDAVDYSNYNILYNIITVRGCV